MSSYDAIIVENLTYRSIDVSYNLLQGLFVTQVPALSMVIIDGVRLENLTESVRSVLVPRGYLKVKQYLNTTKIPKPAYWIESGLPSRCLAIAALTSNIHTRTDYSFHKVVTGLAALSGMLVYTPAGTAYTIVGTASGIHALSSHILAEYKITKALSGLAGFAGTLDYTPVAASTWDPSYPGATGFTYTNGNDTVALASQFAARGTKKLSTGKWYFEILCVIGGANEPIYGIIPDSADGSIRIYECGQWVGFESVGGSLFTLSYNGSNLSQVVGSATTNTGETAGVAVDLDTGLVTAVFTGGQQISSVYSTLASEPYRPAVAGSGTYTLNTAGPFTLTPPAGYSAWG